MSKNILVIDDDSDIRQVMKDVLELHGFNVVTASDGNEAVSVLDKVKPSLIFLDLMMPGMNGWEFLDFYKDSPFNETPVIICSAYHESAKSIKTTGVLTKPFPLKALLEVVKTHCPMHTLH